MTDGHLFNISLGGRVGNNPGQFKLYSGGLAWKKHGGGNPIEVDKADITSVTWMKIPRSYQLSVGTKDGLFYRFFGLCEQGAQTVGMGAEAQSVPVAAKLFDKANDILGYDLLDLCTNGPKEKLDSTVISQL